MKTAYIHIGHEKTGTTSLQIFLQKNNEALTQNNLTYLGDETSPYVHGIGHFPIVASFYEKCPNFIPPEKHRSSSEILEALSKDVIETEHDIILSCEHFSSRLTHLEEMNSLKMALSDREIKIICYLRRQDEQAVSLYSTLVKSGHTEEFSLEDVVPENRYFNYATILKDWAMVFGYENVIVRDYSRQALVGHDICTDFLNILNVNPSNFTSVEEQNISLDSLQVDLLRHINKYLTSYPWGTWDVDLQQFEKSQDIRVALSPLLEKGKSIRSLCNKEDRYRTLQKFKATNMELIKLFDNVDFVENWYKSSTLDETSNVASTATIVDFEKSLISCGLALTRLKAEIKRKDVQLHSLELERNEIIQQRDIALRRLKEIIRENKPLTSKIFKSLKRYLGLKK